MIAWLLTAVFRVRPVKLIELTGRMEWVQEWAGNQNGSPMHCSVRGLGIPSLIGRQMLRRAGFVSCCSHDNETEHRRTLLPRILPFFYRIRVRLVCSMVFFPWLFVVASLAGTVKCCASGIRENPSRNMACGSRSDGALFRQDGFEHALASFQSVHHKFRILDSLGLSMMFVQCRREYRPWN